MRLPGILADAARSTRAWGSRIVASALDQGVIAATSLALNILLARWLPPDEFGAFVVAFSVFLLVLAAHTALITEPMAVIGATRYGSRLGRYRAHLVRGHAVLTGASALTIIAVALALGPGRSPLAAPLLGAAVASPIVLLLWLLRRECYLRNRPALAARASAAYGGVLLAGVVVLRWSGSLSASRAFLIMAMAGAGVSLLVWRALDSRGAAQPGGGPVSATDVAFEHWRYGKWVLAAGALFWVSDSIFTPLVGAFAGLEAAGAFRAMQTLGFGVVQVSSGLALLLTPLAAVRRQEGSDRLRDFSRKAFAVMVVPPLLFAVVLWSGGEWIVRALFGASYERYTWLVYWFSIASLLEAAGQGAAIALAALERPSVSFWARVASASLALTVGVALLRTHGIAGAAVAYVAAVALFALIRVAAAWRLAWTLPAPRPVERSVAPAARRTPR